MILLIILNLMYLIIPWQGLLLFFQSNTDNMLMMSKTWTVEINIYLFNIFINIYIYVLYINSRNLYAPLTNFYSDKFVFFITHSVVSFENISMKFYSLHWSHMCQIQ